MLDPMSPVRYVETIDDAMEMFRWLSEQPFITTDTETSGFDLYHPSFKIRLIQFGSADDAWVVDFNQWRGLVADVFRRYDRPVVMHNARYDHTALWREGIDVPWSRVHDTMIMMRLARPTESAALKSAADKYVSSASSRGQQVLHDAFRRQKWDWSTVPLDFPPYRFYAALDTVLTARLYLSDVGQEGLHSPVYPLEMQVKAACTKMERRGMHIDAVFCERKVTALRDEADMLRASTLDEFDVNIGSATQLSHWLAKHPDALALMTKETDGGKLSVDKEVLVPISMLSSAAGEVARRTLRMRRDEKIASSYLENFLGMRDHNDLVHPQIETVAARTGRMSVKEPGLQTLPKPTIDSDYRMVREAVTPADEDHVIVSCDSDQIELRLVASITHDPGMIEAFREADKGDTDFFTSLARGVYGDSTIMKSDKRRDRIKSFCYSSVYGAGLQKMALTAGVPVAEMREVRDGIAARFPGFFQIGLVAAHQLRENGGYVETAYGRRLPVSKDHAASNYIVQGTAADVLKQSIINAAQAGLDEYMMVPVHDEIVMHVPRELAADAKHELIAAMTSTAFDVPLTASGEVGENWAECK